ncbi:MAG: hypothetical protein LBJ38_02365 [Oscillospiraceae bacterium]|nr:hypothetical protein [Oscillospiraceae bacterium]
MAHRSNLNAVQYTYADQQQQPTKLRVVEGVARKPLLSPAFYAIASVCVLLVICLLSSRIQLTEVMERLNQSLKKVGVLESEELILRTKLEEKVSVVNLEKEAMALGMGKAGKYQIDYINISCADEVKVYNT